jgi:hypothetical protein
MGAGPYNLKIENADGDSFGYLYDHSEVSAARTKSAPPDLPVTTSTGVTEANSQFSGRDAAPPYPVSVNNWQGGAGQRSYNMKNADQDAFKSSYWMDVSDEGHLEIGPLKFLLADTTVKNIVGVANGALYCSFSPAGADPRNTIRALGRYTAIAGSSAGNYLSDTSDTSLIVTDATDLTAVTSGQKTKLASTYSIAIGDFLFCPAHRELLKVTNVAGTTITVSRGQGGTTAIAHTAGETWWGFKWVAVDLNGDFGAYDCTAITEHGGYTYAAIYTTGGADAGGIYYGPPLDTADLWASYAATTNVVALASCAGYLCGVRQGVGSPDTTTAGYWTTAGVWTVASVAAATSINPLAVAEHALTGYDNTSVLTAGLAAINNWVYWVTTDGQERSSIYRYQPGTAGSFALVAQLPQGFIASSAIGHLGNLYIGGWTDQQYVDPDNVSEGRYKGSLYIISGESSLSHLVSWGGKDETGDVRVRGLAPNGPNIHVMTTSDVRIFNVEKGAWWHYADISNGSVYGETGDIDWTSNGFVYDPTDSDGVEPDDVASCTGAYTTMVLDTATSPNLVVTDGDSYTPPASLNTPHDKVFTCSSNKWGRYTVDGPPATDRGTLDVEFGNCLSAGGTFLVAGANKEVRVRCYAPLPAGVSASRPPSLYLSIGNYSTGSYVYSNSAAFQQTEWVTSGGLLIEIYRVFSMRITLSASGARLYIDGDLVQEMPYDSLKTVTGSDATKTWWAIGWPGVTQTNTTSERIGINSIKFTPDLAYPPDYVSTPTVTDMKGIAVYEGRTVVPAPGLGVNWIDPRFQHHTAWLETSDSTYHMGTVEKLFSTVDIQHSAIIPGQSVSTTVYVDGVAAGSATNSSSGSRVTTANVSRAGKFISVKVTLTDTANQSGQRDWAYRLRVSNVTAKFFVGNSKKVRQVILNCRRDATMRNGRAWDCDPDAAIRHVFDIAEAGEVCYVTDKWADNTHVTIGNIELVEGYDDANRYDSLCGTLVFEMREVSE